MNLRRKILDCSDDNELHREWCANMDNKACTFVLKSKRTVLKNE
jgi:hypothetical protein